jgi:hypothetical protein
MIFSMKKKILLSLVMAVPFIALSQDSEKQSLTDPNVSPVRISANYTVTEYDANISRAEYKSPVTRDVYSRRWIPMSFIKIGNTKYDLQTNASIGRRIQLHSDGTVSAVFTTAPDNQFTNRGTGYNYYDGTNWSPVNGQSTRIEDQRTGWPSIGILSNGNEITMGHSAANGGWVVATNDGKGSSNWSSSPLRVSQTGARPIWGRMAVSGDYVYLISNYADSSNAGEPRAPVVNGVNGPMTFSRSTDGGATWPIKHTTLPGFDSSRMTNGNPDGYAIDARDSFVAIIFGDLTDDVSVWKSSDYGTTFTKIIADTFKYAPYSVDSLMLDTPFVSDGTYDILLDANGKIHAWWGLTRVLDEDISDESFTFYPAFRNLVYWNETTPANIIASGTDFDRDGDGNLSIQAGTYNALQGGNIPTGLISVARLGNSAVLHMPSAGIADDGTIFVSYSLPMENDIDPNNINLRDICITYSEDGGATWAKSQNVTQRSLWEDEFACVAKTVNDYVHMVFQSDQLPGTNLQSNSSSANNHPVAENGNDIYYAAIPVSVLKAGQIGTVGTIDVNKTAEVFVVSQNQPNPFNDVTKVITYLDNSSDVTLTITNTMGQVVKVQNYSSLNKGNHELFITADDMTAGIYFYTITAGKNSITKRMIVE